LEVKDVILFSNQSQRFFTRHHPLDLAIHLSRRSTVRDTEESSGSFWDSCS